MGFFSTKSADSSIWPQKKFHSSVPSVGKFADTAFSRAIRLRFVSLISPMLLSSSSVLMRPRVQRVAGIRNRLALSVLRMTATMAFHPLFLAKANMTKERANTEKQLSNACLWLRKSRFLCQETMERKLLMALPLGFAANSHLQSDTCSTAE